MKKYIITEQGIKDILASCDKLREETDKAGMYQTKDEGEVGDNTPMAEIEAVVDGVKYNPVNTHEMPNLVGWDKARADDLTQIVIDRNKTIQSLHEDIRDRNMTINRIRGERNNFENEMREVEKERDEIGEERDQLKRIIDRLKGDSDGRVLVEYYSKQQPLESGDKNV